MESSYWGIDMAQIIFGGAILVVFIFFAVWGIRSGRPKAGPKAGPKPGR